MSININFNLNGGCGRCGGMGGFNPMGGMGGFNPMGGMGGFNNPMMQMMQMMQMLMSLMMGMGGGMPMTPGQFGGGMPGMGGIGGGFGGGSGPIGGFLGGGGGGGGGYNTGGVGAGGPIPGGQFGNGSGQATLDLARQYLGRRSRDIKGEMPHFSAAGGLTNNCADFVSSALVGTGRLSKKEVNCKRLEQRMIAEGWRQIPASQAKAGDVAFNQSRGHVQLCQGNGKQIGSNNVRPGLQYITEGNMMRNSVVYTK